MEHLSGVPFKDRLQALTANIRSRAGTSALAYLAPSSVMKKNYFIKVELVVNVTKLIYFVTDDVAK
jgi:hypothetical protein